VETPGDNRDPATNRTPAGWSEREVELKRAYDAVERHIEDRYGMPVLIGDVLEPNTGDFNGVEIKLDHAIGLDMALFVLAHLFGHTVQWATSAELRELGLKYASSSPPPELMDEVRRYETDATRYAIQLFADAGVRGFDAWLTDWAAADWAYLEHFYRTGEKRDFREFLRPGTPRLTPLSIPRFAPERWVSRYSF
jgi:hypothetical protein